VNCPDDHGVRHFSHIDSFRGLMSEELNCVL
jgi:hypothetical protein